MSDTPEHVLGWRERIDLPEWGIRRIRAKVDTGARTSAIDVSHIEELENGNIRFEVVAQVEPTRKTKWVEAPVSRVSTVRPSSGEPQTRYVCTTTMRIGPIEREVEISLVARDDMICRMLVGRTAIEGVAVVDPSRKLLLSRRVKPRSSSKPEPQGGTNA